MSCHDQRLLLSANFITIRDAGQLSLLTGGYPVSTVTSDSSVDIFPHLLSTPIVWA